MTKTVMGDVCAHLPADDHAGSMGKPSRYLKVGTALVDERGRISLKIDCLPLQSEGWTGWLNIFPKREKEDAAPPPEKEASSSKAQRSNKPAF